MFKTKVKFIIAFVAIVFAIILFNTSTVNATSYTSDELEEILDLIPDEFSVDVEEVEYEKAKTIIVEYVTEILENNGIDVQDLTISANTEPAYNMNPDISIYSNSSHYRETKSVSVIYNNSDDYNSSDEQYVKGLTLENPKYLEMDLDYLLNKEDIWDWFIDYIENYYENIINDSTVKVKIFVGAGDVEGLNLWTMAGGIFASIFKNGKLYDGKDIGNIVCVPVITVPSTVSDDDLTNYVIDLITETYSDIGSHISKIVSGTNEMGIDITNGYTVYFDSEYFDSEYFDSDDYYNSYIIINRETSSVDLTENETNIKLGTDTTVVPSNTVLYVEPITTGSTYETVEKALSNVSQFLAYDITLLSDGVEIQPNGNVKISIPIPEGFDTSNLVVYRIDEDGTKTNYDVTVKDGYAVFETNHFSTYVLAELASTTTTTDDNTAETTPTTTTTTTDTTTDELDETPKTGTNNTLEKAMLLISSVGIIGILLISKRRK